MSRNSNNVVPQRIYSKNKANLPKKLPIIGLGCSSFSSFFSDDVELTIDVVSKEHPAVRGWIKTIRHAVLNRGINLLDTAPWYGHGISETVVGYALETILHNELCDEKSNQADRSGPQRARSDLVINTKVGRYEADPLKQFDFSYDATMKSVQRSIDRMNCGYIDVLQLHDPEFAPSISILLKETIPAMLECKRRGLARALGMTGYPLGVQHEILVRSEIEFGTKVFDQSLVYCHNNIHDNSLFCDYCFSSHRTSSDTFAGFCQQSNIYLMAAAPLSMGLLTQSGPPDWHPAHTALKEACREASRLCQSKGVNISSLAILFSLSFPSIGCTLLGMKDEKEVDVAADLASRFSEIDFDNQNQDSVLAQVLTVEERNMLQTLLDVKNGPFSQLNEDYRWDGKALAADFRAMVDEMRR